MTMSTHPDQHVFGGRYRVTRRIAGGGMGDVWRAKDEVLGRWVAIKVLRSQFGDSRDFRDRFRVEAQAAAALAHPAIATVYDYGEEIDSNGSPRAFIVMEFVDGESLEARLREAGPLSPAEMSHTICQAAEALQEAHDHGIVHRDVKPGNLMLRPDRSVKLTDFGIARIPGGAALTEVGMMVGTAQYMAPELVSGSTATPASDIYALGVVAYTCVTGHSPFPHDEAVAVAVAHVHDNVPPLPSGLPVPLRQLIEQMLEKDPQRRPATAGEIATRMRVFGSGADQVGPVQVAASPVTTPIQASDLPAARPDPATAVGLSPERPTEREVPTQASSPRTDRLLVPPTVGRQTSKHRLAKRLSAVGVVAVVVLALALILSSMLAPAMVTVPDLQGLSTTAAQARLGHLGLHATVRTVDGTVTAGRIVSQSPRSGVRISSGTTVVLTADSGYVNLNSATLTGQSVAQVLASIQDLGLQPQQRPSISPEAAGTVLAVAPSGRLRLGTSVVVTVATPPPPTTTQPGDTQSPPSTPRGKQGKRDGGNHGG